MLQRKIRRLAFIAGGIGAGASFAASVTGDQPSTLIFVTLAIVGFTVGVWPAKDAGGQN